MELKESKKYIHQENDRVGAFNKINDFINTINKKNLKKKKFYIKNFIKKYKLKKIIINIINILHSD